MTNSERRKAKWDNIDLELMGVEGEIERVGQCLEDDPGNHQVEAELRALLYKFDSLFVSLIRG